MRRLLRALTAGVIVPRPVIDAVYLHRGGARIADVVGAARRRHVPTPTDDELQKFYDAAICSASEYRGFTCELHQSELEGAITISDEQLKTAFENTGRFRDLVRRPPAILAPSEEKAKAVEAALSMVRISKVAVEITGQDTTMISAREPTTQKWPAFSLRSTNERADQDRAGLYILRVVRSSARARLVRPRSNKQLVAEAAISTGSAAKPTTRLPANDNRYRQKMG